MLPAGTRECDRISERIEHAHSRPRNDATDMCRCTAAAREIVEQIGRDGRCRRETQFVIIAPGELQRGARVVIEQAQQGRRRRQHRQIDLRADCAGLADVAEIGGQTVRHVNARMRMVPKQQPLRDPRGRPIEPAEQKSTRPERLGSTALFQQIQRRSRVAERSGDEHRIADLRRIAPQGLIFGNEPVYRDGDRERPLCRVTADEGEPEFARERGETVGEFADPFAIGARQGRSTSR